MANLTIEVPDDILPALRREAETRHISVEKLVEELSIAFAAEFAEGKSLARQHLQQYASVFARLAQ